MDQFFNAADAIQASVNQNNAWSAQQADKQMAFQREMSNTAHQREIADLKAAGLNPVLSAKLGGASTPSGAMASGDTSGTSALVDLLQLALQTANSAASAAASSSGSTSGLLGSDGSSRTFANDHVSVNWTEKTGEKVQKGVNQVAQSAIQGNIFGVARGLMSILWATRKAAIEKLADPKTTESYKAQMEDVSPLMLEVASNNANVSSAKAAGPSEKKLKSVAEQIEENRKRLIADNASNSKNPYGNKGSGKSQNR